MAKYLLLKHYRGSAPEAPTYPPLGEWAPEEVSAHFEYMEDFANRLRESGEYVDSHALSEAPTSPTPTAVSYTHLTLPTKRIV